MIGVDAFGVGEASALAASRRGVGSDGAAVDSQRRAGFRLAESGGPLLASQTLAVGTPGVSGGRRFGRHHKTGAGLRGRIPPRASCSRLARRADGSWGVSPPGGRKREGP